MKRSLKRAISFILAVVMAHSLVVPPVFAISEDGLALQNRAAFEESSQNSGMPEDVSPELPASEEETAPDVPDEASTESATPVEENTAEDLLEDDPAPQTTTASEENNQDFAASEESSQDSAASEESSQDSAVSEENNQDSAVSEENNQDSTASEESNVVITGVKTRGEGTYIYGTYLRDIVDLTDAKAKLNGEEVNASNFQPVSDGKPYNAGTYESIEVSFDSNGSTYTGTVCLSFTITKREITVDNFTSKDKEFIQDAYYITRYANNKDNTDENALCGILNSEKNQYTACGYNADPTNNVKLTAEWTYDADNESNPEFDPKGTLVIDAEGKRQYNFYAYTAELSFSNESDKENYTISSHIQPKGYINVIPVNASQTLDPAGKTTWTSEIANWTDDNWKTKLGLPTTASVTYKRPTYVTDNEHIAAGKPTFDSDKTYDITGWIMEDGTELTLNALKKAYAGTLKLTPVYAASGDNAPPAWATLEDTTTFTLIINASYGNPNQIVINGNVGMAPGMFEYGTPLGEIIDLNGLSVTSPDGEPVTGRFTLANKKMLYEVGTYTDENIRVMFYDSNGMMYDKIFDATFTIVPVTLVSFKGDDAAYVKNGYWEIIYAKYDNEAGLRTCLKSTYTAIYGKGKEVTLEASWIPDDDSPEFKPMGYEENIWYSYTAHLTVPNDENPGNFEINVAPKEYVRVIPVTTSETLTPESKVLNVDTLENLTEANMNDTLGLPQTASVTYLPVEAEAKNTDYNITGWKMEDDKTLTLDALKEKAKEVTGEKPEVEVTLTPVYAVEGDNARPQWATLGENRPEFTLVITNKTPATGSGSDAVKITAPKNITYGGTLEKPKVNNNEIPANGEVTINGIGKVTCRYAGVNGTTYNSTEIPKNAGSYRVIATLDSETYSGRWTSDIFEIKPKKVTITSITVKEKEYDGTKNADTALDIKNAVIDGKVEGDDLSFTAVCKFKDEKVGTGKDYTIEITLTGEDAGNYTVENITRKKAGTIVSKQLTINDSGLTVTKALSVGSWKMAGELNLEGVVNNEVSLDMRGVTVSGTSDTVGENKTVTLSGIKLIFSNNGNKDNYSLEKAGLNKEDEKEDTYTYTFNKAEITENPRPELNTHFTVTIPDPSPYNGEIREAVYTANPDVIGLGAHKVTYAKKLADGSYGTTTEVKPVNTGIYKVAVSFEKGNGFDAAQGRNAITAGFLIINKATVKDHEAVITIAPTATKVVYLSELGLADETARGVKIKNEPGVTESDILESVTGAVGKDFFTVVTKNVTKNQSDEFTLTLTSDNYETVTVKIRITVDTGALDIKPPKVKLRYLTFSGDTALRDILELEGGSASLLGEEVEGTFYLKEPNKICTAGTYTNYPIDVVFISSDWEYINIPVTVRASFTIEPAGGGGDDFSKANNVYFTIYANSNYNENTDGLIKFIKKKKPTHAVGEVIYDAVWSEDSDSAEFNPKGTLRVNEQGEQTYDWYSYTSDLGDSNEEPKPKAYIRVVPVCAVTSLVGSSKIVKAADITALKNDSDMKALLPTMDAIEYEPVEDVKWPTEPFTQAFAQWGITDWKMGDTTLTFDVLKEKAMEVTDGNPEVEITLTPVYAESGQNAFPEWATLETSPTFTLVITGKDPIPDSGNQAVKITAPKSITYGETLENPRVNHLETDAGGKVTIDGIGEVTCRYVGVNGTTYDSTEKPKNVGSYRVAARLDSETYSGRWTSQIFKITPKEVTVTGITVENKVYDGTANANEDLNIENAVIDGKVEGDDLRFTAICYFDDEKAGENKDYTIEITLTGTAADNYTIENIKDKGTITARTLTINDSSLTVTMALNVGSWKIAGELKTKGVVNNEIGFDISDANVSCSDNTAGDNKTVTLSGIKLNGSDKAGNYSFPEALVNAGDGTCIYTFSRAEITNNPRPEPDTHFTVTIPEDSIYDGKPREAVYTANPGVTGLGAATVTYAVKLADGKYGEPTTTKPVNSGSYKVAISFAEGDSFDAAEGNKAVMVGILTINKATDAEASANIIAASATTKVVPLSELGLDDEKARGARLKNEILVIGSAIFESVTGEAGSDFFTLETKEVKHNQTGEFTIELTSDNYETVTVTLHIIVDTGALNITPPNAKLKQLSFYGDTALKDILELEGGSATLLGKEVGGTFALKDPDIVCTAGTYTNHPIDVVFNSTDGQHKDVPVTIPVSFTIIPVADESDDFSELNEVYLTIYANSKYNENTAGLIKFVKEKKPTHAVEDVIYDAVWREDPGSVEFNPKGTLKVNAQGEQAYDWYSYTADLTGSSEKPRAYIRVVPVYAATSLADNSQTVRAADITALKNDSDMKTLLNLPVMDTIKYESDTHIEQAAEPFTQISDTWSITGWKMDGRDLTLKELNARVNGAGGREVTVTLTPVYADAPDWATITGVPTFTLTITPAENGVLPGDIPTDGKIPDGLWIAGIKTYTYTGKPVKPEVRVYDSDKLLKAGQDYTISYKNNTKANDASKETAAPAVVVKGKGNYTGTEKQTFQILPLDLNDTSITAEDITVAYNNKVQKKVPIATYNGKKLANNKDFTVSYPDKEADAYKSAGTYNILLTAKQGGNFTGTRTVQFTITNNMLISGAKVKKIAGQTYTGEAIEPNLEVTMKKAPLVKDTDYTVTYVNNIESGTATAILTGIGKYAGTKKVTFKINGTSLKGAEVSGISDRIYNGMTQEQEITVTLNNKMLTEDTDYKTVYSANVNAGTATVTINGIHAYSGTIKKTFRITAYDINTNTERLLGGLEEEIEAKYLKGGSRPKPELTFAGMKLAEGTDYTVSYQNNKAVTMSDTKNKPAITIKGRGNFKGTLTKTFTIAGKALNDTDSPVTLTVADKGFVDKAGKYISIPTLTDADGKKLAAGKDYESTVIYTLEDGTALTKNSKVSAGTKIKVKVTGKGAYTGELESVYQIKPNDFNKAKISIRPQTYTGKAVTLDKESVTVKIGKETLTFGTDYEIVENSYANNVRKGTASVTIVGKGNYGGTKTVKFKITARKLSWFWLNNPAASISGCFIACGN